MSHFTACERLGMGDIFHIHGRHSCFDIHGLADGPNPEFGIDGDRDVGRHLNVLFYGDESRIGDRDGVRTWAKINNRVAPVAFVVTVRTLSISTSLEASTVAPATTAPAASRTTPEMGALGGSPGRRQDSNCRRGKAIPSKLGYRHSNYSPLI
jgi:hypothetical protein